MSVTNLGQIEPRQLIHLKWREKVNNFQPMEGQVQNLDGDLLIRVKEDEKKVVSEVI